MPNLKRPKPRPEYATMTPRQFARYFEERLEAILKRAELIAAIRAGDREVAKIIVRGYTVPSYRVRPHRRFIVRKVARK